MSKPLISLDKYKEQLRARRGPEEHSSVACPECGTELNLCAALPKTYWRTIICPNRDCGWREGVSL